MPPAPLRTTVNSFDLFDTLIARRCVTPTALFEEVERTLDARGFCALRQAAEHHVAQSREQFELRDIYDFMIARNHISATDAQRLMAAELDAEFDNAVPIHENLSRVRAGDLVVSDMYLSADTLRRVLQHVGLHLPVHIFASAVGKQRGAIWGHLAANWIIVDHLGDNLHSDIETPRRYGVPTTHYAGAQSTPIERTIWSHGYPTLAQLMRAQRLRNPFAPDSEAATLWRLAAQLNLPLLALGAMRVRRERDALGVGKILFSARDCYFLAEIFAALFPTEPIEYVYVSREALNADAPTVAAYLRHSGLDDALICDIAATGGSWLHFATAMKLPCRLFSCVFIDNWSQAKATPQQVLASPWLKFSWLLRSSALRHYTAAIEVLNSAPHPSCKAIRADGAFFSAIFHADSEFSAATMQPLLQQQQTALATLRPLRPRLLAELERPAPDTLYIQLLEAISAAPLLNALGKLLRWPPNSGAATETG